MFPLRQRHRRPYFAAFGQSRRCATSRAQQLLSSARSCAFLEYHRFSVPLLLSFAPGIIVRSRARCGWSNLFFIVGSAFLNEGSSGNRPHAFVTSTFAYMYVEERLSTSRSRLTRFGCISSFWYNDIAIFYVMQVWLFSIVSFLSLRGFFLGAYHL